MYQIPFLVQFKKQRSNYFTSESIEFKYDENLGYNIIKNKDSMNIMAMTHTAVKAEQPDEALNDYLLKERGKYYLQTKTFTEVKTEQPDEIDEQLILEMMSTQTFTKTINEATDQDY